MNPDDKGGGRAEIAEIISKMKCLLVEKVGWHRDEISSLHIYQSNLVDV